MKLMILPCFLKQRTDELQEFVSNSVSSYHYDLLHSPYKIMYIAKRRQVENGEKRIEILCVEYFGNPYHFMMLCQLSYT